MMADATAGEYVASSRSLTSFSKRQSETAVRRVQEDLGFCEDDKRDTKYVMYRKGVGQAQG